MSRIVISNAEEHSITSSSGETYSLFLGWPDASPPSSGYPLFCVLDGNQYFVMANEIARMQAGALGPIVVAAIGYPEADPVEQIRRRYWDLTNPTPPDKVEPSHLELKTGGAAAFAHLLEREVFPRIADIVPFDESRVALFGHSLAGLFALDLLFGGQRFLHTIVAASPGIFWNDAAILESERRFSNSADVASRTTRLLITVGGQEQEMSEAECRRVQNYLDQHPELAGDMTLAGAQEMLRRRQMVDHAEAMAARLRDVVPTRYIAFENENHISVVPASLSSAINHFLDD